MPTFRIRQSLQSVHFHMQKQKQLTKHVSRQIHSKSR
jgi:hypothetical protein